MNDINNRVTDKSVREALLMMANNLVSGKSEFVENLSDLQTLWYNLDHRLRVRERYTS